MGTNVYDAPLMVGDKIYASGGSVRAFEAESGKQLWMARVRSTDSMAYDDGVLCIYTTTPDMVALFVKQGERAQCLVDAVMVWNTARMAELESHSIQTRDACRLTTQPTVRMFDAPTSTIVS